MSIKEKIKENDVEQQKKCVQNVNEKLENIKNITDKEELKIKILDVIDSIWNADENIPEIDEVYKYLKLNYTDILNEINEEIEKD